MRKLFIICLVSLLSAMVAKAQPVASPNGKILVVTELTEQGQPCYRVFYDGQEVIQRSALGLKTNIGDFTQGLVLKGTAKNEVNDTYQLRNIKQSQVDYEATEAVATYALKDKSETNVLEIIFRVSNRDVAFRYRILPQKETRVCVVESEASGFVLPDGTTTFLCPQSKPMGGFARTSPSYETPYSLDEPIGKNGWGEGYTFPCLFKTGESWLLISETGTDGNYVGCRLLNEQGGAYRIGFPQQGELNGAGA
ncbi:MAG: glycoside hydrolase family 97 N-terminal domain-containing protein, partial [Prevotella sp.]|nr:glycoside hydrolase family 97 N-terminal domain-containing protein [Prevotella sp.]